MRRSKPHRFLPGLLLLLTLPLQAAELALSPMFGDKSFNQPVYMLQPPGDARVWFVLEKGGKIFRLRADGSERRLVLNLAKQVESGPMEAGLLGMAFHPEFADNGQIFLSYTRKGEPLTSVLASYRSRDGGLSIEPDSEEVLLEVEQPYRNHNGGHIAFGPDGYLYFGLGDGGSAGDPKGNGQNRNTLLGAILRLDVNGDVPYAIPKDNPFAEGGGRPEIFAWGLRNPWRWSFDRQNGDLWVGDVGQNEWEEVNLVKSGDNLGWNILEGSHCYRRSDCSREGMVMPRAEYSHRQGCSVTGGYVYRGEALPALRGRYLYGDFCSGRVWALDAGNPGAHPEEILYSSRRIASFAEDRRGELYLLDFAGGRIFQLTDKDSAKK
ncbi:MAG: PQQ-dependent sugar dehydrogenase [Pseudomonadota bacterium]